MLKCSRGEWTQVATYADHVDPLAFTDEVERLANKYNKALVVVESNGVGQAVLSLLNERGYPNLYHEARFKPGFTSTAKSLDQATGWLIDALMEELVIHDKGTVEQRQSYKTDKRVEEGANAALLRRGPSTRRRERHHWDKVSALLMAIAGARYLPSREKPAGTPTAPTDNVVMFTGMSYDAQERYRHEVTPKPQRKKPMYRSIRKRRR